MARPIWSGVISFGLVSIPVGLYTATKEHEVSFHQFQRGTGDRIRYQRVNERTGKEVEYGEIVKGAEVGESRYVMIDSDELDAIAPGRSRSLDIHTFVDRTEIDPVYFQKTYYLGPASPEAAKAYALMRDALADSNRVAIGTLVMRGKEYLTAIRSDQDILVLETMFFADEVREPKEQLDGVPARAKAKPQELAMAMQLIDSMAGSWRPDDYRDTYTDRVKDLISAKKKGEQTTVAEAAPEATNVVDLMSALQASVEAAKQGRPSRRSSTGPRRAAKAAKAPAKAASAKTPAKATAKGTTTAPAKKVRKAS
jgi:DNA end-binding protein Ku